MGCTHLVDQGSSWETIHARGRDAFQQGKYPEAKALLITALAKAKSFGSEDPRLATTLNELGLLEKTQGSYGGAVSLYRRALDIMEKAHGPNHPEVATILNNLGVLYDARGKYAQAEPLLESPWRSRRGRWGRTILE